MRKNERSKPEKKRKKRGKIVAKKYLDFQKNKHGGHLRRPQPG